MPLDLTLAELETAARACRAMAENMARRYAELAAKFEAARKRA
jgi:hypothetical protein